LSALNPLKDQLLSLARITPSKNLGPFTLLKVFVMREEMFNLITIDLRQICIVFYCRMIRMHMRGRNRNGQHLRYPAQNPPW